MGSIYELKRGGHEQNSSWCIFWKFCHPHACEIVKPSFTQSFNFILYGEPESNQNNKPNNIYLVKT